jgi:hypothetical protein
VSGYLLLRGNALRIPLADRSVHCGLGRLFQCHDLTLHCSCIRYRHGTFHLRTMRHRIQTRQARRPSGTLLQSSLLSRLAESEQCDCWPVSQGPRSLEQRRLHAAQPRYRVQAGASTGSETANRHGQDSPIQARQQTAGIYQDCRPKRLEGKNDCDLGRALRQTRQRAHYPSPGPGHTQRQYRQSGCHVPISPSCRASQRVQEEALTTGVALAHARVPRPERADEVHPLFDGR